MYYCIVTDVASTNSTLIKFRQPTYNINESDRLVQPVILLCGSLSTDIIIQVTTVDVTAYGEQL